jgi:hypothetical protein
MRSWQFCDDFNLHGIPHFRLHVQTKAIAARWAKTFPA